MLIRLSTKFFRNILLKHLLNRSPVLVKAKSQLTSGKAGGLDLCAAQSRMVLRAKTAMPHSRIVPQIRIFCGGLSRALPQPFRQNSPAPVNESRCYLHSQCVCLNLAAGSIESPSVR